MPVTIGDRSARSVTANARRSQIITAASDVIAEVGYGQASFARIAERAGLSSTRLISYHFAGKDDLITAVAEDVVASIGDYVARRLRAETSAVGKLRAYIEGMVEYTMDHRARLKTLLEIILGGGLHYDPGSEQSVVGHLEAILCQGQIDGEFRQFEPRVVSTAVQRAVEGLPFLLESVPDLDCAAYGRELVTLFDLGTRRSPA